jgi:hypothetical protein
MARLDVSLAVLRIEALEQPDLFVGEIDHTLTRLALLPQQAVGLHLDTVTGPDTMDGFPPILRKGS